MSDVRRRAVGSSGGGRAVLGPLTGYHHEAYAIPLPRGNALGGRYVRANLRMPRPGVVWFDRRYFASEDSLLRALHGRIDRIPEVIRTESHGVLQGFVEGRTLGAGWPGGRSLSARHLSQLGSFFNQLVSVDPYAPDIARLPAVGARPEDGDSAAVLGQLIDFTEQQVYRRHERRYGPLFAALGVAGPAGLDRLRERSRTLTGRPFALLHGDLHRDNFVIDLAGDLWVIDWELAMIGDPLYDLATHLHLMGHPAHRAARTAGVWRDAVERARPGSSAGWSRDLPVLLAYKRLQSVYTDVVRAARSLEDDTAEVNRRRLSAVGWRIQRVLDTAREPLGPGPVPARRQIMAAYREWLRVTPTRERGTPPR
ncbi:phosphotransferase [Streptomyces sp. NPDC050428]|uniref:phosphotransferase n=1 Tax=Streptomyces sp. NPDC050428 TaxID=3155757 RepID=UPI00343CD74F